MNNQNTPFIQQKIQTVCQQQDIISLLAVESGSRAWGFASPDSDYDVRLLYQHAPQWYLQLFTDKDNFEFITKDMLSVPFDIGGWDIRKALQLIYKSNAVIFEWLQSPIIYHCQTDIIEQLRRISLDYWQVRASYHHYRGMAKTASTELVLQSPIKLKKFFYLLRALLACQWTLIKQSPPPVIMMDMVKNLAIIDEQQQQEIKELILLKSRRDESYQHKLSESLQQLIATLWAATENPMLADNKAVTTDILDDFFRVQILKL